MNQDLALKVLSNIMKWDEADATKEFDWLRLMARIKYDEYHGYFAGARFLESLAIWLQQFTSDDREIAYSFIKERLVYISNVEFNRLVENFYHDFVSKQLVERTSADLNVPNYLVWSDQSYIDTYNRMRSKIIFMGMSDGARIDVLRRSNVNVLNNEQIQGHTQINLDRWLRMRDELWHTYGEGEKFNTIYLIDDFVASGTTLLREKDGHWKGNLERFWSSLSDLNNREEMDTILEGNIELYVHHYIATHNASIEIENVFNRAKEEKGKDGWYENVNVSFSFSYIFPEDFPITSDPKGGFLQLAEKYYDDELESRHSEESGIRHMKYGYKECALPLILEHNTPNNSVSLVWADTQGEGDNHQMRPLFRRKQRHVD